MVLGEQGVTHKVGDEPGVQAPPLLSLVIVITLFLFIARITAISVDTNIMDRKARSNKKGS